jgi:hypothetical protein
MKVYCLINDEDGRAVAGTADLPEVVLARARRLDAVDKVANEPKEPHHPGKPTMIRIAKGSHTIITTAQPSPFEEHFLRLKPGDHVLFLDFAPAVPPATHYAGHHSVVGPEGAVLERWEWDEPIDIAQLGWQSLVTKVS